MPRKTYSTPSLPKELTREIAATIEGHPETGYSSVSDFCRDAVRRRLDEIKKEEGDKRFAHINVYDDHVTIADRDQVKFVNVYFKESGKPFCDLDETTDCDHVKYALHLPEVREAYKRKGLLLPPLSDKK